MVPEDYLLVACPTIAEREMQCPACGLVWWADGHEEDGAWWPGDEGGAYYGRCGCEGEA